MEQQTVHVYGQLLAAAAELEAMKTENYTRSLNNESPAYDSRSFYELAQGIQSITNQLFQ